MIDPTSSEPITLSGSFHCGAVRFTVTLTHGFASARRCSCSICRMRGAVAVTSTPRGFRITKGGAKLATYRFNTMSAEHHFCTLCAIYTHHKRRSNPRTSSESMLLASKACRRSIFRKSSCSTQAATLPTMQSRRPTPLVCFGSSLRARRMNWNLSPLGVIIAPPNKGAAMVNLPVLSATLAGFLAASALAQPVPSAPIDDTNNVRSARIGMPGNATDPMGQYQTQRAMNNLPRQDVANAKLGSSRPAKPGELAAGAAVNDKAGILIARIEKVDSDGVIVSTGTARVKIPADAFGHNKAGLLLDMTKDQFEQIVGKANGAS